MPTKIVDVQDAQRQLADLLVQVAAGTEIILTDGHQPRARLVPFIPIHPASRAWLTRRQYDDEPRF